MFGDGGGGRASVVGVGGKGVCFLFPDSTLFVGNLSFNVGEDDLVEFFSSAGHTVQSVRIITTQGRSKG